MILKVLKETRRWDCRSYSPSYNLYASANFFLSR